MSELRRGLALSDCPGMAHFLWRSSLLYKALQLCGMPFAGKVPGAGFTNYHLRPASWLGAVWCVEQLFLALRGAPCCLVGSWVGVWLVAGVQGGDRTRQEKPGEVRRGQGTQTRRRQERPGDARRGQKRTGEAKRRQETPEEARKRQRKPKLGHNYAFWPWGIQDLATVTHFLDT